MNAALVAAAAVLLVCACGAWGATNCSAALTCDACTDSSACVWCEVDQHTTTTAATEEEEEDETSAGSSSNSSGGALYVCTEGNLLGATGKTRCLTYQWKQCRGLFLLPQHKHIGTRGQNKKNTSRRAVDGKSLFTAAAVTAGVLLLGAVLGVAACCCCCCRRRAQALQDQADEEYIRNGGALDYKEQRRRKKQAERQELRTPLMNSSQTRAQMRAKWGIGTDKDSSSTPDDV